LEHRHEELCERGRRLDPHLVFGPQFGLAPRNDPDLLLEIVNDRDRDEIKSTLERRAHFIDAAVPCVRRRD
jgi:hypothetical protein